MRTLCNVKLAFLDVNLGLWAGGMRNGAAALLKGYPHKRYAELGSDCFSDVPEAFQKDVVRSQGREGQGVLSQEAALAAAAEGSTRAEEYMSILVTYVPTQSVADAGGGGGGGGGAG